MKSNVRLLTAFAVTSMICAGSGTGFSQTSYEKQLRDEAAVRAKDPKWKPACVETAKIQVGGGRTPGTLNNFCLDPHGNILAAIGGTQPGTSGLRVYSPSGELLKSIPMEIKPSAVCTLKDGTIFAAGEGKLVKMDASGKVLGTIVSPVAEVPVVITKEIEEMVKQSGRPLKEELARMRTSMESRRSTITGLAATDQDVFMVVPTPNEFTSQIYRFDHSMANAKVVVEKLRGCCGQMDVQTHDGKLWIPHNARHAIEARDRDGKQITKFGSAGKVKADDFGGCCEPKNMRVLANGDILAAESGPPTCIKRFSSTGKFIEVVALVEGRGECVRVTVAASKDGSKFYMLDTSSDSIRIFGPRS